MDDTFLKANIRKLQIIDRSSAEAELYAAALRASEARSVESMMSDLGFVVKPVLIIDAKSNRTHSTPSWTRKNETHRRGAFVVAGLSQIEQVESLPRQERRRSCGHRDEGAQQQNH